MDHFDRLSFATYWPLVLIITVIIFLFGYLLLSQHIRRKSTMLQRIYKLNSEYSSIFHSSIKSAYTYTCHKKSKSAFDHTNFQQLLHEYLRIKGKEISRAIQLAESNRTQVYTYQAKYHMICSNTSSFRFYLLQAIEQRLCRKAQLTPVTEIHLNIISTYTSPKGRNHYRNSATFSQHDVTQALQALANQEQLKQSKQYQRKIMTDSLRYDIMKRDGFRCQLCGASARDGAQLHVDHIIPISKGGQTVQSNLRTLCSRCNLGKGSKYDYNGAN